MAIKLFIYGIGYALAVNAFAFLAFGWDKRQAIRQGWRVSEQSLLLLALIGGTPGSFAGQRYFRHKTVKQPFRSQLIVIAALQFIALGSLLSPQVRATVMAQLSTILGALPHPFAASML